MGYVGCRFGFGLTALGLCGSLLAACSSDSGSRDKTPGTKVAPPPSGVITPPPSTTGSGATTPPTGTTMPMAGSGATPPPTSVPMAG